MRLVAKALTNIPATLKPMTKAELDQIEAGDYTLIKDKIYKGTYTDSYGKTQSAVRDSLNVFYHKKCAYCERYCKAEIEHYRPKKAVYEEKTHKGYYWLCYEWTNLVPSCRYCNTEGGKGNQFPILGKRVYNPSFISGTLDLNSCKPTSSPLVDETPFLLHPELDNPKHYFKFDNDLIGLGVEIQGFDDLKRGAETVRICNLNRYEVVLNRNESVIYPLLKSIDQVFEQVSAGLLPIANIGKALKLVFSQVAFDLQNDTLTHTLLRWFIIESDVYFDNLITKRITNPFQSTVVSEAFKLFKNGQL